MSELTKRMFTKNELMVSQAGTQLVDVQPTQYYRSSWGHLMQTSSKFFNGTMKMNFLPTW